MAYPLRPIQLLTPDTLVVSNLTMHLITAPRPNITDYLHLALFLLMRALQK